MYICQKIDVSVSKIRSGTRKAITDQNLLLTRLLQQIEIEIWCHGKLSQIQNTVVPWSKSSFCNLKNNLLLNHLSSLIWMKMTIHASPSRNNFFGVICCFEQGKKKYRRKPFLPPFFFFCLNSMVIVPLLPFSVRAIATWRQFNRDIL